jgi:hypothetical protein
MFALFYLLGVLLLFFWLSDSLTFLLGAIARAAARTVMPSLFVFLLVMVRRTAYGITIYIQPIKPLFWQQLRA